MSSASERETSRVEDQAYCLLGIFGISMPLLYGGDKAFIRLQEEIMDISADYTFFAWKGDNEDQTNGGIRATTPTVFKESSDISIRPSSSVMGRSPWSLNNEGLYLELPIMAVGHRGLALGILPSTRAGMKDQWIAVYLRDPTLNIDGKTILSWTLNKGHKIILQKIVAHGADINARVMNGDTPLSWALDDRPDLIK
ncbi:hypothetical protein BBP40_004653 [Aspergillus hancockii]|nr:hypothetical protein BBP40_004653 [Aspergillus hancockii]